jgi:hypothetical protein
MSDRKCPDCSERLSFDAMRCACGWGARKDKGAKYCDPRCTYEASKDRCSYPVGRYTEGNTTGWCIFHRQNVSHIDGAEIVRQSKEIPYLDAIQALIDRAKNAPGVVNTAWDIAKRHGSKSWRTPGEPTQFEEAA